MNPGLMTEIDLIFSFPDLHQGSAGNRANNFSLRKRSLSQRPRCAHRRNCSRFFPFAGAVVISGVEGRGDCFLVVSINSRGSETWAEI